MKETEYKGVHASLTFAVSWGKVTELPIILTLDFNFLLSVFLYFKIFCHAYELGIMN